MSQERLGLAGRLASDRPLLVTLVLSFGLAAMAVAGAANGRQEAALANLTIAGLSLVAAPMALSAFSANTAAMRVLFILAATSIAAFAYYAAPSLPIIANISEAGIMVVLGATYYFVVLRPLFGPAARFAYIAAVAASLGMAGGLGLVSYEMQTDKYAGVIAASSLGVAAIIGVGLLCDYVALFARGAAPKQAAGLAARYATAPVFFAVIMAAAAAASPAVVSAESQDNFQITWLSAAAAIFTCVAAVMLSAAAAGLMKITEIIAVEENSRRRRFRSFWRPLRRLFSPSAAFASSAIIAIALVVFLFEMDGHIPAESLLLCVLAAAISSMVFFSIRSSIFIFSELVVAVIISAWFWELLDSPTLSSLEEATVIGLASVLFAQLALSWRDARSPWLNARETTEAAMMDGVPRYVAGAGVACFALFAAYVSGNLPHGAMMAGRLGLMTLLSLMSAPAFMTALSEIVKRN